MILVQDQYTQNSRKNYETELHLKQETTKQFYSDPKECWEIESVYNEEILTSGNDSECEDNVLYGNPSDFADEVLDTRGQTNFFKKKSFKPKNVRFGGTDYNCVLNSSETSSGENEEVGDCGGCDAPNHHRYDPELTGRKDQYRVSLKPKCRAPECGHERKPTCEVRPKSEPERNINCLEGFTERRPVTVEECKDLYDPRHRTRRKDHRCGRSYDLNTEHDIMCKRSAPRPYKFEGGDDSSSRHRFGDCCNHCPPEDGWVRLEKKNFTKLKPNPNHKHVCHMLKEPSEYDNKTYRKPPQYDTYHTGGDRYYPNDEYCEYNYGVKGKKKTLEAVQEQQEQFSDSTYKVPCTKYSSQTISGELAPYPRKKSSEKLTNTSHTDWLFCEGKGKGCHLGEKHRESYSRIHKMRSRRTRMNRLKSGWKKAFVQTVRDGARNERVGVIVMGSRGPEFYTKNSKKSAGVIPFRKSKSFLDGAAKSFEVMTVDCKNVFLSSSEPGTRTNYATNDLVSPKDESKIDEKFSSKFNKNVTDIVKTPDEKFYKGLSKNEFQEIQNTTDGMMKGSGEGSQLENEKNKKSPDDIGKSKHSTIQLPPFESITPRSPKTVKKPEKKINELSRVMADALNEQGRKYKECPPNLKDREQVFLELREKYPPKELSPEVAEANLSLWGMTQSHFKKMEGSKELGTGDMKKDDLKEEIKSEDKSKAGREEVSHSGSVKSTEQISLNKQRRKKYYESTTSLRKSDRKLESSCAGDAPNVSDSKVEMVSPSKIKKAAKIRKWTESSFEETGNMNPDPKTISAVFKDLVGTGCAISQGESENLQKIFNKVSYKELCSNDATSSSSCDVISMIKDREVDGKKCLSSSEEDKEDKKKGKEEEEESGGVKRRTLKEGHETGSYLEEVNSRKVSKMKNYSDEKDFESKLSKKVQSKEKSKKKVILEDKMKLLREALPGLAAENEAAHLKQLKKYIDKFIDRVEASTSSEFRKKKENRIKTKESSSTDSSEVRVDARKILDFVSNPFKKISSDVTINIAKKLTDALVQDKEKVKGQKNPSQLNRQRRNSSVETDEELVAFVASSGSEHTDEPEPTYLKQLKKMRNEHLNNIVLEVKRLSELLRFLDRCNRLTF